MRRDDLYLADIVEATDDIAEFVAGLTFQAFVDSKMVRGAVLQKLIVIGEAASRVSDTLRDRYDAVDWEGVASFRNRAVHGYFGLDWQIVWTAATSETPLLKGQVSGILDDLADVDDA